MGGSEYLIFQQKVEGEPKFYKFFEKELIELLSKILISDWNERPLIDGLLESEYIKGETERLGGWEAVLEGFDTNFEKLKSPLEKVLSNVNIFNKKDQNKNFEKYSKRKGEFNQKRSLGFF